MRNKRLTITVLLVVAAIGAIALGVIEEAAALVVIFSLVEAMEAYATDKARGSISALMELTPRPPPASCPVTRRRPWRWRNSTPVTSSWCAPVSAYPPTAL